MNQKITTTSNISKILYGISETNSIDITRKILLYLKYCSSIDINTNINYIIKYDPFKGQKKKIYIYCTNLSDPIVINENNGKLDKGFCVGKNFCLTDHNYENINLNEEDEKKCFDILNDNINENINTNILIYLIYHDEKSYKMVEKYKNYKYIKLFFNESTKYFESNIFRYLCENKDEWINKNYVGILTYSYQKKINMTLENIYEKIMWVITTNKDCKLITYYQGYTWLFRSKKSINLNFHGKIKEIFDYTLPLLLDIKLPIPYDEITPFYCNYWLTTSELMLEYVEFALKYMEKLDDNTDIILQNMLNSDAKYMGSLSKERLKNITGFPYYTNHCFVMERLPCIYFWKRGIKPNQL